MQYLTYRPGPPLADYVAYLWLLRDAPAHPTERIVPSGTLELVVNLRNDALHIQNPCSIAWQRYSGTVISGAYRRYFVIDTRDHASIVGVHSGPAVRCRSWVYLRAISPIGMLTSRRYGAARRSTYVSN